MIDHFYSVLILLGLRVSQSLEHFQEHRNVISFCNSVSVWVHLQSPREATLSYKWRIRINDFIIVRWNLVLILSNSREVLDHKNSLLILRNKFGVEIYSDIIFNESVWLLGVDFFQLSYQISRLFNQRGLWHFCELHVKFSMELIQLFYFILHALTLA